MALDFIRLRGIILVMRNIAEYLRLCGNDCYRKGKHSTITALAVEHCKSKSVRPS